MARKPNYQFERMERDRLKASKNAMKASEKREQRERDRAANNPEAAEASETPTDET